MIKLIWHFAILTVMVLKEIVKKLRIGFWKLPRKDLIMPKWR